MKNENLIAIDFNWLAEKSSEFNGKITMNQLNDPENKNEKFIQENLKNLGKMEMINEIIDKYNN